MKLNMRLALGLALGALYLACFQVIVPVDPGYVDGTGEMPAPNNRLRAAQKVGVGQVVGPETVTVHANGSLFVYEHTGWLSRIDPDSSVARVRYLGGRPLSGAFAPDGQVLYVTDAVQGLLAVDMATLQVSIVCNTDESGAPLMVRALARRRPPSAAREPLTNPLRARSSSMTWTWLRTALCTSRTRPHTAPSAGPSASLMCERAPVDPSASSRARRACRPRS